MDTTLVAVTRYRYTEDLYRSLQTKLLGVAFMIVFVTAGCDRLHIPIVVGEIPCDISNKERRIVLRIARYSDNNPIIFSSSSTNNGGLPLVVRTSRGYVHTFGSRDGKIKIMTSSNGPPIPGGIHLPEISEQEYMRIISDIISIIKHECDGV